MKTIANNLNDLLDQYVDTFDNTFPIQFMGVSEEEAIKILKECLEKNEPYEFEYDMNTVI